jgi:acyl-CoA synthetase (AMP-forming)/AMP-acid ligase II
MLELFPRTVRIRDYRSGLELDHAALVAAVAQREATFRDMRVSAGSRLVVGHSEGLAFIVDLLAAWRIGATAVAVPPSLTPAERSRVAEATEPELWIGAAKTESIAWLAPEIPDASAATPGDTLRTPTAPDAPALVLMTSGTTSRPKGVVLSYRALHARIALNLGYIDRNDLACSLALLPLHFGHGLIGNCLTPLAAGSRLIVWPEPGVAGLAGLANAVETYDVTFMSSVPAMWRIVLKACRAPDKRSLRRVHVGSAPLSVDLWESIARWCGTRRVVNCYGTTETANWIGGHSLEEEEIADNLVGRPWGATIRVIGADGALVEKGEGDVAVATPSLMSGYLGEPELTAKVVQGGWFFTGDRGAIDARGRLRLIGRREHEINWAGIKISAEEIDLLLERHPGVAEACAFPVDDPVAGEIIGAAVVPISPGAVDAADLLGWCQTQIRREAMPARIFLVDSLPRSDRGKINRSHVRSVVLDAGKKGERK